MLSLTSVFAVEMEEWGPACYQFVVIFYMCS
jgi:hypothetical protein